MHKHDLVRFCFRKIENMNTVLIISNNPSDKKKIPDPRYSSEICDTISNSTANDFEIDCLYGMSRRSIQNFLYNCRYKNKAPNSHELSAHGYDYIILIENPVSLSYNQTYIKTIRKNHPHAKIICIKQYACIADKDIRGILDDLQLDNIVIDNYPLMKKNCRNMRQQLSHHTILIDKRETIHASASSPSQIIRALIS